MSLDAATTERELTAYRLKLIALSDRYAAGARTLIAEEAQACADALTCLLEEAPLHLRGKIDYLIDRYESLRIQCLN